MLRKLALHLAAQPDTETEAHPTILHELEEPQEGLRAVSVSSLAYALNQEPENVERQEEHSPECMSHFCAFASETGESTAPKDLS